MRLGRNEVTGDEILSADEVIERYERRDDGRRQARRDRGAHRRDDARRHRPVRARADVAGSRRVHCDEGGAIAMIRVLVCGGAGRMGSEVVRAVTAADGMEVVACVDPGAAGARVESGPPESRSNAEPISPRRSPRRSPTSWSTSRNPSAVEGNLRVALERRRRLRRGNDGALRGEARRARRRPAPRRNDALLRAQLRRRRRAHDALRRAGRPLHARTSRSPSCTTTRRPMHRRAPPSAPLA